MPIRRHTRKRRHHGGSQTLSYKKPTMRAIPLEPSVAATLPRSRPAIVIPFRDDELHERAPQLTEFVAKMNTRNIPIFIIEQSNDGKRFNRGALLNIGVRVAEAAGATSAILHDVDLIPTQVALPYYYCVPIHPVHIGWGWQTKYDYENFLGGILHLSIRDMYATNGYPNNFFGWGGEDDVLRNRLLKKGIPIWRPTIRGETVITELKHTHAGDNPALVNPTKREQVVRDDGRDGIINVQWTTLGIVTLASNVWKITVEL